ncbi:hypothetical protein KQI65_08865 [bacterium]|nr:hypothetical protein [bacterium]
MTSPAVDLQQRLDRRIAAMQKLSTRFVQVRVVLFLFFLGGFGLPLAPPLVAGFLTLVAVVFFLVAARHRRTDRSIERHRLWKDIKRAQQARRALQWEHLPAPGVQRAEADHPFAGDIGIFGDASLHRLLDLSVSRRGSSLLGEWLTCTAPEREDILARQRLVKGLVPLRHFREHMQLEYAMVSGERLDGEAFLAWLRSAELPRTIRWVLPLTLLIAAANLVLFLLWGYGVTGPWFMLGLFAYGAVYFANGRVRESFMLTATQLDAELGRLKTVFRFIEDYPTAGNEALQELTTAFHAEDKRPSRHIRGILRDVIAAGLSMNPVMMLLLNIALPWDFIFAARLERKRKAIEKLLPDWLEALQQLEALQSLANLAALYPEYSFPALLETPEITSGESRNPAPVYEAEQLGHPLIPIDTRVANDFRVDSIGTLFLVTGSNMSGKSTFLRTVGINFALAWAGGPVAARRFSSRLFRLYTCIEISDSLREGVSYFYAEVRRLRRLLEQLDSEGDAHPLFFLIDEIFKGTNNIERHVGGEAYLKALAGRHGTGIVSTHDIELTSLEGGVEGLVNMHFREQVRDERMVFDYTLREGPCPTTNALVIMRLEGLPVPPAANLESKD